MNSIALIDYDGNIWCYGNNFHGKLGLGDTLHRYHLERINIINDAKFIKVEIGYGFMVALDSYGNIWTSGNILEKETQILTLYDTENQFIDISCGPYYFFAIDTDNHLWSVGSNNYGVLGLGIEKKEIVTLTQIPGDIEFQSISCGLAHNLAVDVNNNLWGCGRNLGGVLGNNILPIIYYSFVPIMPNFLVKFVHCTNNSSFIIDVYGDLWSSGDNNFGKLGLGISNQSVNKFIKVDTITNINVVCSGSDHTLALDRDGNVWSVGNNSYGQLGLNDFEPRNIFTKTNLFDILEITRGSYDSFFLDHTGTMWVCGRTIFGSLNLDNKSQKNLIQKSLTDVRSLMGTPITKRNTIKSANQIL